MKQHLCLSSLEYETGITEINRLLEELVVKTAISLPDAIFEQAEALAQQLGISRSELYTEALKAYLRRYNKEQILVKLNEVYSKETSELDPVMEKMQYMSLPREDW